MRPAVSPFLTSTCRWVAGVALGVGAVARIGAAGLAGERVAGGGGGGDDGLDVATASGERGSDDSGVAVDASDGRTGVDVGAPGTCAGTGVGGAAGRVTGGSISKV